MNIFVRFFNAWGSFDIWELLFIPTIMLEVLLILHFTNKQRQKGNNPMPQNLNKRRKGNEEI